ncbi:MAG: DUF58 domain-containing protein [Streptosporangiaceae bacterium]
MTELDLTWSATAHYRRLATVGLLPLLAAVVLGYPGYLVLAAPFVAALAVASRRPGYAARVRVQVPDERCVEGEDILVQVSAEADGPAAAVAVRLALPAALQASGPAARAQGGGAALEASWPVTARRWGRWGGQVTVSVTSRGGLFTGTATVSLPQLTVYPRPPSLSQLALPADLRSRIGDHVDRRPGEGVEFAGIRPFAAGDRLRRINWPVTSRRGSLHVNQLAAEHAAEIVAVIDAFTDVGPPGETTLDRAVRGAAGVARAYTRAGDRVGVITLDAPLRWVPPGTGPVQFFRIAESVLDARGHESYVSPDLGRIPRPVLPPGALVILFSPLLDERAIGAATDLRDRGYPVIIADVLATRPQPPGRSASGSLALRIWQLERQALRYRLESLGIPVTGFPGEPRDGAGTARTLDGALSRFVRRPVRGGAR